MYQNIAWYATCFFVFLILLAFSFVYGESRKLKDYEPIQKKGYKIRKFYFLAIVAVMGFASAVTLSRLPYHKPHAFATSEKVKVVEVKGYQFGWDVSTEEFFVDEPIQFRVTSKDVTHGFGLYDPDMQLLSQTQAMPGYTNDVYIKFNKPGTYKILCLEYCSVGHHVMIKNIVVKEKGGSSHEE